MQARPQPLDAFGNRDVLVILVVREVIETVIPGVLVMRDLAEGNELVPELLEIGGQLFYFSARFAVIRFRAVPRRPALV